LNLFVFIIKVTNQPDANVFAYMFDHIPSYSTNYFLGAFHASEVEYVFQTLPNTATSSEVVLSKDMSSSLVAFAKSDNPSTSVQGLWNRFTNATYSRRRLNTGQWSATVDAANTCSFWFSEIYPKYFAFNVTFDGVCATDHQLCNPETWNCCTAGFERRRHAVSTSCGGSVVREGYRCVGESVPSEFEPRPEFYF
jgi:hypothetical protein